MGHQNNGEDDDEKETNQLNVAHVVIMMVVITGMPSGQMDWRSIFPSRHDPGRFNGYDLSQTIGSDTPMFGTKVAARDQIPK